MRALTLYQPYAALVALGEKTFETRSWATNYRGPLLIHAAKRFPQSYRRLCGNLPFAGALAPVTCGHLPRGAVVAVADLVAIEPTEDLMQLWRSHAVDGGGARAVWNYHDAKERAFGDYGPGRYAWRLQNVRRLARPVPASGHQRLWYPTPALVAAVTRSLRRAS